MAKVVMYAGPTASGKSSLALKLAQEKKGVILNADSLQVYRGLEILTAHPSDEDQQLVPHHLYGCLDPWESCSVGRWLSLVLPEIQKAHRARQLPIIVGGTGLYLKALLEGLSPLPPIDPEIRKKLQDRHAAQESLYKELQIIDPELSLRVNPRDQQRIIRGLEVFYGTGKSLSFWQTQKPLPFPFEFEKILFLPPKDVLEGRIKTRLDDMLAKGVLDEVAHALTRPLSKNAQKAIGLRELGGYLQGSCSLEEAKDLTLLHTYQYAKRQRTWFRHQFK